MIKVSLVIPILNEENSIRSLISSIENQTRIPNEVVFVDGGSTDKTIELVEQLISQNSIYKIIKSGRATPGRGRNIGVTNARYEWIAFTDAGIELDARWLEALTRVIEKNPSRDVVYGNCDVRIKNLFEKCAVLAYVSPKRLKNNEWYHGPFIASALISRSVWEKVGGFPDIRAAEDLMFMEAVEKEGFSIDYAPQARVLWHLRPDLLSTFQKFVLYSKHNVWVNRQWDWHYGILKQYLLITPFVILAVLHSWWWLIMIVAWAFVRTAKRIFAHRNQFGITPLFNPIIFFGVMLLVFVIDTATFIGWIQAKIQKKQ